MTAAERHVLRGRLMQLLLGLYKGVVSPVLHFGVSGACRFQPTCSEYAVLALHEHGAGRGAWLAMRRVMRCHPFCVGGFDPVPVRAGLETEGSPILPPVE
ncbi:MAG TPA: membrane protein insertion efficiency factor YidD [Acidisarcina sp.]